MIFFFFKDPAATEIYTLSLHDALPICRPTCGGGSPSRHETWSWPCLDRKSTRLNSSHQIISYAVFCLKKKKRNPNSSKRKMSSCNMVVPLTPRDDASHNSTQRLLQ